MEIDFEHDVENVKIKNTRYLTLPAVIHGNGPSKLTLNQLADYFPRGWSPTEGCMHCAKGKISLSEIDV